MSIAGQNFTDNFIDHFVPHAGGVQPSLPPAKKKVQTPYKPRLSTVVKRAMEDAVKDADEVQGLMEDMLAWLEVETSTRERIRRCIAALPSPLDHRMASLLDEETETLLRIGKLEMILARMAMTVTRLQRRLEQSLANARDTSPSAAERKARKAKEEQTPSGERRQ